MDILVSNKEQLRAVKDAGVATERLYLEQEVFGTAVKEELPDAGEVFAALPFVVRTGDPVIWESANGIPVGGVLARNLETVGMLKECEYRGTIVADGALYVWNREALAELAEMGVQEWTVSPELGWWEVPGEAGAGKRRNLAVYGRVAMMVSANCVRKTTGKCGPFDELRDRGERRDRRVILEEMTDRTGRKMVVACHCTSCYNVIWNAYPTSLHREKKRMDEVFGDARRRVQFTTETYDETRAVAAYYAAWEKGAASPDAFPLKEYTTGRFKKRVE